MAKKDAGKLFEEDIKKSIPEDFYIERYKDDTARFSGVSNPADFRLYKYPLTFLLECKSHKGKSLPLAKIRNNQIKGMYKASKYMGIYAGFLINFRDLEETYYVPVKNVVDKYYIVENDEVIGINPDERKSIPVDWCRKYGVRINQQKKRVRYAYDLSSWLGLYYGGLF